jgi:hypothetical protein
MKKSCSLAFISETPFTFISRPVHPRLVSDVLEPLIPPLFTFHKLKNFKPCEGMLFCLRNLSTASDRIEFLVAPQKGRLAAFQRFV